MKLFDTHSHYNDEQYNEDRTEIIDLIYKAGVEKATVVGDNIESSKKAVKLAKKYNFLYSAVRYTPK